ncbi:MAG TPA: carboxylesterase family protein, partial [Hyphomonadaceae bacterium]|nr:carboxylesterase family protein [Hyphomonadaceae bacterium]
MKIDRRTILGAAAGFGVMGLATGRASADPVEDIFPVVETTEGKIRGVQAGGIRMFKGVRYGASTAGANRFMPPKAPPKWKGIKDAFDYGNYAPQMPNSRAVAYTGLIEFDIQPGGMGEDCLVLNIWTPTTDKSAKLPVMFHIHGGGYYGGSGNSPGYDGENLARYGKALVITVNHRLGAFGYLNLMDEGETFAASGGVGMMDLVQALQWVKANAEAFGGDPNRVLVFGQSGGGSKTSVLMAMPSAKGLFHRAGVMSGAVLKLPTREEAAKPAAALMKALGLSKGQGAKLQAMPFEQVLTAQAGLEAADRAKGEAPRSFSPFVNGGALPRHPFDPDAPAISADIPMISSTVLDERAYRLSNYDLDEAGFRKYARDRVGAEGDKLADMYRAEDPKASPFVLEARLDTDSGFRRNAITQAERKAQAGKAKVWSYLYRYAAPAYDGRYGVPHGSDVGPSLHEVRGGLNGPNAASLKVADELASAWVAFASTGDPNNKVT